MAGFIKIWRKITDSQVFQDAELFHLFMYCLLRANYEDSVWEAVVTGRGKIQVEVKRGQLIFGSNTFARKLGKKSRTLSYRLAKLEKLEILSRHVTNNYTIVTICNYEFYQDLKSDGCQPTCQPIAKQLPTVCNAIATSKEVKEIKEEDNTPLPPLPQNPELADFELPRRQEKAEQVVDSELAMKAIQHVQTQWGIAESEAGRINNRMLPGSWKRRDKDNCVQRTAEEQGLDFVLQVEPWVFQTVRNIAKAKNIAFGWGTVAWYLTTPEFHAEKAKRERMAARVETPVQPKEPEKPDTTLEDFRKLPDSERQQWIERARGMPFAGKNERWIEKSAAGLWKTETSKGLTA